MIIDIGVILDVDKLHRSNIYQKNTAVQLVQIISIDTWSVVAIIFFLSSGE